LANTDLILRSLREAVLTMLAALATMACALAIEPEPGLAVLGIVLCLSLSRSQLDRDLRGRIEAAVALPVISLAAIGEALLLKAMPWAGAMAFVAAISLSIWLRRFGSPGRRAGTLIALPFVVLLVAPNVHAGRMGLAATLALPIVVALLALMWVSVFHAAGRRIGWLTSANPAPEGATPRPGATGLRPRPSSRMALQMAAALGASFVVGYVFFASHWAWLVLTAFIVGSGNQGRLDVAYKSLLRVLGAAAGSVVALAVADGTGSHGAGAVGLALGALFLGLWLRPMGYAWWALFITLALALLQAVGGAPVQGILAQRLAEIVVGAVIAVAAAWFILPVRSTDVLRRRIADTLATLAEATDPATQARSEEALEAHFASVVKIAPTFRAVRVATRRWRPVQPADWIDELMACRAPAIAMIEGGAAPGRMRAAIGAARKAMREPDAIRLALANLRASMEGLGSQAPSK
jgi:uncharacterized membrane protein YccC